MGQILGNVKDKKQSNMRRTATMRRDKLAQSIGMKESPGIGARVIVSEGGGLEEACRGIIRFFGETQFAPGVFVGVELEKPLGKHDGIVQGIRYFQTRDPKAAVFV